MPVHLKTLSLQHIFLPVVRLIDIKKVSQRVIYFVLMDSCRIQNQWSSIQFRYNEMIGADT